MKVHVNGEAREFAEGLKLEELMGLLGVRKEAVVAEVNLKIVPPAERADYRLGEGDRVELIQFVGGG